MNDMKNDFDKTAFLTGIYLDKKQALEMLGAMNVNWTARQVACTAEPDADGNRQWPWFLDDKGVLRIDEGFIRAQFAHRQIKALKKWAKSDLT